MNRKHSKVFFKLIIGILIVSLLVFVYFDIQKWRVPFYTLLESNSNPNGYPKPSNTYLMSQGIMFNDWGEKENRMTLYASIGDSWPSLLTEITHYAWREEEPESLYLKRNHLEDIYRLDILTHDLVEISAEEFSILSLTWYPAFRSAVH